MVITANAREIGALLKTFKDKILEKAAKLTVANSLKLEGKTLAEVAAMGGGSSDSTDLVAAINEVADALLIVPVLWSGDMTVANTGSGAGYLSALFTGSSALGQVVPVENPASIVVHASVLDSTTDPDSFMVAVAADFADSSTITEISVDSIVLTTQTEAAQTVANGGGWIHQYMFDGSSLTDLLFSSIGSVFRVEIR